MGRAEERLPRLAAMLGFLQLCHSMRGRLLLSPRREEPLVTLCMLDMKYQTSDTLCECQSVQTASHSVRRPLLSPLKSTLHEGTCGLLGTKRGQHLQAAH